MSNSSRLIPFTAHVFQGLILEKPRLFYIKCPVIALGRKEYRGLNIDYCVIKTCAFTIEYKRNLMANRYFTDELWREYMRIMCGCCEPVTFVDDMDFLTQNGVAITC